MPVNLIVGAGPAGLTAAYTLSQEGIECHVVESSQHVGGIARTCQYKGYRFDIGGHRFFTQVQEISELWERIMGDDFLTVKRVSRIFYENKYYDYPLSLGNTLRNLGPIESLRVAVSYMRWQLFPSRAEDNLEQWVTNRFGKRLFDRFFQNLHRKSMGYTLQ